MIVFINLSKNPKATTIRKDPSLFSHLGSPSPGGAGASVEQS